MNFQHRPALATKIALLLPLLAALLAAPVARADDAPDPPPPQLAIHGFGIFILSNDYLTPRGLLVTDKDLTIQIIDGLVFDLFQNPGAPISDIALVAGTFIDVATAQHAANVGSFNEFDFFIGPDFKIGSDLDLSIQYSQFISPPGNFTVEQNLETSLSYSDNLTPDFQINPYGKLFYAISGDSTVVTGQHGNTFDVELGAMPTLPKLLAPVTVSFPTYITVGPEDFFGGGGDLGVFSTGVKLSVPLDFIPPQLGHYHADLNGQYYHEINSELVRAQTLIGTGPERDIGVVRFSLGFNF
jgi:hypothetical protein